MRNIIIGLVVFVFFGISCRQEIKKTQKEIELMISHQPKRILSAEDSLFFGNRPFMVDTLSVEIIIGSMIESLDTLELSIGDSTIYKKKAMEDRSDGLVLQRKDFTDSIEMDFNNYPREAYSKYRIRKSIATKPFNFKINKKNYLIFDVPKDNRVVKIIFFGSVVHVNYGN